jgi:hypothetical protein
MDQHQVLAIGYRQIGEQEARLQIWDNNLKQKTTTLSINFDKSKLEVSGFGARKIRGIFAEDYSAQRPPGDLGPLVTKAR